MNLNGLFRVSAIAATLTLGACGGDINISEGDIIDNSVVNNETSGGGTPVVTPDDTKPGSVDVFLSGQVSTALGQTIEVRQLTGRLTDAEAVNGVITLTNDTVWALTGPVFVGNDKANSVTLAIEPGTIIFGSRGADYLVISRDSKVEAQGTATSPIIFTSYNEYIIQSQKLNIFSSSSTFKQH